MRQRPFVMCWKHLICRSDSPTTISRDNRGSRSVKVEARLKHDEFASFAGDLIVRRHPSRAWTVAQVGKKVDEADDRRPSGKI
jgi:hypothetical protein